MGSMERPSSAASGSIRDAVACRRLRPASRSEALIEPCGSIDPIIDLYKKKSKSKIDQAVHDLHDAAQSHMVAQLSTPFDATDVKAGVDASFEKLRLEDRRHVSRRPARSAGGRARLRARQPADFSKALRYGWDEFTKDKADQIRVDRVQQRGLAGDALVLPIQRRRVQSVAHRRRCQRVRRLSDERGRGTHPDRPGVPVW